MTDNNTGTFVWRELMTTDGKKSARFYGELFNWHITQVDMGGGPPYQLLHAKKGGKEDGGMMDFQQPGMPAAWVSYVKVDDVDATAKTAEAAGGKVLKAASDIPKVGRFAVLADPEGAVFIAYRSADPQPGPAEPPRPSPGEFCWETLSVKSIEQAKAFYGKVLGWTAKAGPGGNGTLFYQGERMVADVMEPPPGVPSNWMTYVVVDDLAAANARATQLGGSILMAKVEVPNMGAFSVVKDDVGAVIGLFQGA